MKKWAIFSFLLISSAMLFGCCCAGSSMGCIQSCIGQIEPCAQQCVDRCGNDQSCVDACTEGCSNQVEACMNSC